MSNFKDTLHDRVSYLNDARYRLEDSLASDAEYSEMPDESYSRPYCSPPDSSSSYDTSQCPPQGTVDTTYFQTEPNDTQTLLQYERIRSGQLEQQIAQKDELLHEMANLQTELYSTLDQMEAQIVGYKQEIYSYKEKVQRAQGQYDKLVLGIKERDEVIARLEEDNKKLKNNEIQFNAEVDIIKKTVDSIEIQRREDAKLIQDLSKKLSFCEKENLQLKAEKDSILKETANSREKSECQRLEIYKLQQEITDLMKQIDQLKYKENELNSYRETIPARVRDLEKHIELLNQDKENLLHKISSRRSLSNFSGKTVDTNTSSAATSRESNSPTSYKQLCSDLTTYLNLPSVSQLFSAVLKLHKDAESSFRYRVLAERVGELLSEVTRDDKYRFGSTREIWRGLSLIIEEYRDMRSRVSVNRCM